MIKVVRNDSEFAYCYQNEHNDNSGRQYFEVVFDTKLGTSTKVCVCEDCLRELYKTSIYELALLVNSRCDKEHEEA